jgi:hypothetical protein
MNRFEYKWDWKYICEKYQNYIIVDDEWRNIADYSWKNYFLYTMENILTQSIHFDEEFIKKFKGIITWNKRLYELYLSHGINSYHVEYTFLHDDFHQLTEFVPFEDKIKGIACLNKIYNTGGPGDIIYLRKTFMESLNTPLLKHIYGPVDWSSKDVIYQNKQTNPYEEESLKIRNKYLFNLTLESLYHPLYSQGFVTERLWCSFKAKTIPLYLGCYNIEEYCPIEFFIDLRKYIISETSTIILDYVRLNNDLMELANNKIKYEQITNDSYEWQKKNQFGNFPRVEKEIDKIVGYK